MASVSFKITNSSKFQGQGLEFVSGTNDGSFNPPYKEGQIIFVEGQGKIYLDFTPRHGIIAAISSINGRSVPTERKSVKKTKTGTVSINISISVTW